MFTEAELLKINPNLPEDFNAKSKEFWNYVREKLRTQRNVQRLYLDSFTQNEKEKALEFVKKNYSESLDLILPYTESGAELEVTEDPILVQEAASWASMLQQDDETLLATEDMLSKNLIDRDKFVAKRISESLKEGETGLLFVSAGRRTKDHIPSDIRAIKIQPFDPSDYLNSWIATISIRSNEEMVEKNGSPPSRTS